MLSNNNYCVIMAGGVGSRFWPVSRNDRPKQFLDFFDTGRSLLQMTVDRFRSLIPIENMLVVTNVNYRDTILEQVPELLPENILCEPCRRNTAPCIAYAMYHIAAQTSNANIVVAASDHLITNEKAFIDTINAGIEYVSANDVLLTLGMKPTRPETGYGYIQVENDNKNSQVMSVKTFTEKPNLELAKVFFKSGEFLWNSGMFMWNLKTIMSALKTYLPDITALFEKGSGIMGTAAENDFVSDIFPHCQSISIDYGVMEKARNVMVMAADFGWSDLGNWASLYELSQKDDNGNVSVHNESAFYEAHNNIVTLGGGKLAVIEGLSDYIVAENDGVLLICPRSKEQQIRQMVNDVQVRYNGKYN